MKKAISLMLAVILIIGTLTACKKTSKTDAGVTPQPVTGAAATTKPDDKSGAEATDSKEAPMLAEQVKAGKLPTLEERMPAADDIMIEPDVKSIGTYGGSLTTTCTDSGHWTFGPWAEESMFRFKQDGSGQVEANVCKDYSSNDDATVWTIELRKGMKWSDGQPFTADDVIFYYDHMSTPALNADRTPVATDAANYYPAYTSKPYNCYQTIKDGKTYWAKFEKIDDFKFTVTFAAPKPNFPEAVAIDNKWMFLPKHFYINYVARKDGVKDDPTFPLITEEQAMANANKDFGKQWTEYSTMGKDIGYYNWDYAIVPQLRSFIAVKDNWNTVGETYELVRNPYFWKTDSEGHQLPYLDSLKFLVINDQQQIVLKQTAGEIDVSNLGANDYATVTAATQATHSIVEEVTASWGASTSPIISLCQTAKDLDKRALFQDVRFREALSIAVDRNLLNATLMNGQSAPAQAAVPEGVLGYDAEWQNEYTEFNVDKANQLLDEITEPWDKKEGTFRKMKGTNKDVEIIFSLLTPSVEGDYVTLLQTAYKAIGVKVSDKVDANANQAILTNDVEAMFEGAAPISPAIRPDSIIPMRNFACWYGAYGKWYEDGKSTANGGIEPTGDMMELVKAYDAIKTAAGPTREQVVSENIKKIYDLHKKNIWKIGFLKAIPQTWLVNNNIKNFPSNVVYADEYRFDSIYRPEQLYLADPTK